MRSLVEIFVKELSVNRKAVFATGLSNGGQMALRLELRIRQGQVNFANT